jgi:hypothetical protein
MSVMMKLIQRSAPDRTKMPGLDSSSIHAHVAGPPWQGSFGKGSVPKKVQNLGSRVFATASMKLDSPLLAHIEVMIQCSQWLH